MFLDQPTNILETLTKVFILGQSFCNSLCKKFLQCLLNILNVKFHRFYVSLVDLFLNQLVLCRLAF